MADLSKLTKEQLLERRNLLLRKQQLTSKTTPPTDLTQDIVPRMLKSALSGYTSPMDVMSGIAPYKSSRAIGETISEVGVPTMQKIPVVKNIPFGARLLGDPNAVIDLMTSFSPTGQSVAKSGMEHLPKVMKKYYLLERAKEATTHLDDLKSGFGSLIGETLEMPSKLGIANKEVVVNATKLSKQLGDLKLPKSVTSRFTDPIYKIDFLPDGSINPAVGNLQKVRQSLADMMTDKAWEEAPNLIKDSIKNAYGIIGENMKQAVPELTGSLDAFHLFMEDIYKPVISKLVRRGRVTEKPLRGAVQKGAEESTQEALEAFGNLSPRVSQILKDFGKFNQRQAFKKATGQIAEKSVVPLIVGGALYNLLRKK